MAFRNELVAGATAVHSRRGLFLTLIDMRKGAVHSTTVIAVLEVITPKALRMSSDPVVAVVACVLNRMQTARYLKGGNCRLFLDLAEARTWLSSARLDGASAA